MSISNSDLTAYQPQQQTIVFTKELEQWHLEGLFNRSIDAIRIPKYYEQTASELMANKIKQSKVFCSCVNAPKIGRVGQAFFECQNDVLCWDILDGMSTNINTQLTANVYLEVPKSGGELCLWPNWPSQDEYHDIQVEGSYGVHKNHLCDQFIKLIPQQGELIIFNPTRIHSVERIDSGSRLTWSCFIGKESDSKPLKIWS